MRKVAFVLIILGIAQIYAQDQKKDALALYREGKYEEAIEVCETELKNFPRNRDSYVVLGWSLVQLGRHQEVVESHLKALEFARNDYRLIITLAESLYKLNRYEDALSYFQEYVRLNANGDRAADAYAYMGYIYFSYGEYNNADISFSTALYYRPTTSLWWTSLGFSREKAGSLPKALEAFQKAVDLNPQNNEAVLGLQRVKAQI